MGVGAAQAASGRLGGARLALVPAQPGAGRPAPGRDARLRPRPVAPVDCHNGHQDSTYKQWKVGDPSGVLEIIRPLDNDVARARAGLRGTFLLMAATSGSLLGLSVLILVLGNRRRNHGPTGKDL